MEHINACLKSKSHYTVWALALLLVILSSGSLADQLNIPVSVGGAWQSSAGQIVQHTNNPHFEFELTSPKKIEIKLENKASGCPADPYLYLVAEDGTVLAKNDDRQDASPTSMCRYDSKITRRLERGKYTLVAGTYEEGDAGDFVLSISEIKDNSRRQVCNDQWNPSAGRNSKSPQNPRKILRLQQSGKITIDLESSIDTYLYLLNPSGEVIKQDDDSGNDSNSRLSINSDLGQFEAGDYSLVAATYYDRQRGDFTLSVAFDEQDQSSQLICESQTNSAPTQAFSSSAAYQQPMPQNNFNAGEDISKTYANRPFRQIASGGSGNGIISYSSSDEEIATVDASGLVTIHGVGITRITASKAADSNYLLAQDSYLLTIGKSEQAIGFGANTSSNSHRVTKSYAVHDSFTESIYSYASTSDGIRYQSGNGNISYSSRDTSVASVDRLSGEVTLQGAGVTQIEAIKASDNNYHEARAYYTLTVNKASQTIAFAEGNQTATFGDKPFSNIPTGTKGTGALTYSSNNPSIATVNNQGMVTIAGAGTTQITATKAGDSNYYEAKANYTLTVNKATQTIEFADSNQTATFGDKPFSYIPTGTMGTGALTYSTSNPSVANVNNQSMVTIIGVGTTQITATKAGDRNYHATTASYTLTVNRGTQTIEFPHGDQSKKSSDEDFTFTVNDGLGNGKITYFSSNPDIASVNNSGKVTIKRAGTTQIIARKAAGHYFHAATAAYNLYVVPSAVSMTPAEIAYSHQTVQLNLMPIREKSKITGSLQADIESSNHLSYSVDDQPYLGRVEVDAQTGAFSYSLNPESSTPTDNYNHDRFSIAIKQANQLIATEAIRIQINTDPEYKDQWQLDGYRRDYYTGEIRKGWHINIAEPISDGLTGQGVIVAVVDDGMREDPDLEFDKQNSWDFNDNDSNVADAKRFRVTPVATGFHGTKVGKALAATGWNNTGGRGVAPGVTVRAYRGGRPDSFGAHHKTKDVDIFNMSYMTNSISNGVDSTFEQNLWYALSEPNACDKDKNGRTDCPWTQKYKQGLRDGKGAIFTAAAGNEFNTTIGFGLMAKACDLAYKYQLPCQTTIIDSSRNHPALIAVAATNMGGFADYSNHGPANWISAPSLYGTSYSAPRVAGVVALILEANPELSWRDVKYILANSARQVDNNKYKLHRVRGEITVDGILVEPGWITNQAVRQWDPEKSAWQQPNGGYKFHNAYGFGLVDGAKAVTMAKNYPENHLGKFIKYPERSNEGLNDKLQTRTPYHYTINQPSDGLAEAVRVKVKVNYDYITDLSIILESPSGTQSTLLTPFNGTRHIEEGKYLELSSNAFYGESIQGDWTLKIFDHLDDNTDADKHDPLTDDNYCKNYDEDFRCVPPITGNAQFKGWKLLLYGRDKPAE